MSAGASLMGPGGVERWVSDKSAKGKPEGQPTPGLPHHHARMGHVRGRVRCLDRGTTAVTQPRQTRTEGETQPPAPHLHRSALFNPNHCRKCRTSADTKRRTNRRGIPEEGTQDPESSVATHCPRPSPTPVSLVGPQPS